MIKYNNTNNASTTLTAWISASSTTLIVENGAILPAVPFLLTLEHFDNEKVTVREIVKCIAKADNILTIQRGAWTCVQDDSASTKEQGNSAHSFSVGDCASIYWTSEQVQDIQNEIEKKLNIDDFQAWTYVYGATSTWTDAYSITIPWTITSYQLGQVFRFMADVDNQGPATLNINGLWAVEIRKNHDIILDNGNIEAGQIVEVAYDWTYFQMDSQVATVVDLWNIDSLKMSGVVGELYTLDDELYLQDVSEDLDLTQPVAVISVWADKEETHIQRIANGITGNSVSLYIAKVWSPVTNFTVEIRKGIYAEADWRAYWTGDENEIIASKSISYSSFTDSFQKITITFDDDIELQRGDLIDIVCYQSWIGDEKIKNTTNCFIIGWYGNQRWEWNSINYVDNGTITQDVTIPYCEASCFYDKLFCKTIESDDVNLYSNYTKDNWSQGSIWSKIEISWLTFTNNLPFAVKYSLQCNFQYTKGYWVVSVVIGAWEEEEVRRWRSAGGTINVSGIVPPSGTAKVYVQNTRTDSGLGTFARTNCVYTTVQNTSIQKEINIIWKATSILPVSSEMSMVTYGNANWKRFTQSYDLAKPTQNTDFYLWKDAIIVCQFSHTISAQNSATFKIKQEWNDYRIWSWGGWSSWNYSNGIFLNQTMEYRLRWWHTYQIDFNPSMIKEFYLVD